jgi:phage terminase Nu1 subunit (DNA packaging protein)
MTKRDESKWSGPDLTMSRKQVAAVLKLDPARVLQLVKQDWIPRNNDGTYSLVAASRGYVAFLKDEGRRSTQSASLSRVQQARARAIELKTARDAGTLVEEEDALELIRDVLGTLKVELDGIPSTFTRDLADRERLRSLIDATLTRAAERVAQA